MSFGIKERVRQNYSENYFDIGVIAAEISCAGPTTAVLFSHILDIAGPFAAQYSAWPLAPKLIKPADYCAIM